MGLETVVIRPGGNLISPPLHGATVWRGQVASVTTHTITVVNNPPWTGNQFAAVTLGGAEFPQYLVVIRRDLSAPHTPDSTGRWWTIRSNTSNTLTVRPGTTSLTDTLAPGDAVELRRLLSLRDLFGDGATCVLTRDANGFPDRTEEDVIRYVDRTFFTHEIFFHDGTYTAGVAGYIVNGDGPVAGEQLTLLPGQPIMVFRLGTAGELRRTVTGQLHDFAWTQPLQPGANAVSLPWPCSPPISAAGLREAGWSADRDGDGSNDDHIRPVSGTSFTDEIYYHDGTYNAGQPAWVVNGAFRDDYRLQAGRGYVFFVKNAATLDWRQTPPFTLP